MQTNPYFRPLFACLLVLLLTRAGFSALAQSNTSVAEEFITPLSVTKDEFKPAQREKAEKLEKWDKVKQLQYVKLGNLAKI